MAKIFIYIDEIEADGREIAAAAHCVKTEASYGASLSGGRALWIKTARTRLSEFSNTSNSRSARGCTQNAFSTCPQCAVKSPNHSKNRADIRRIRLRKNPLRNIAIPRFYRKKYAPRAPEKRGFRRVEIRRRKRKRRRRTGEVGARRFPEAYARPKPAAYAQNSRRPPRSRKRNPSILACGNAARRNGNRPPRRPAQNGAEARQGLHRVFRKDLRAVLVCRQCARSENPQSLGGIWRADFVGRRKGAAGNRRCQVRPTPSRQSPPAPELRGISGFRHTRRTAEFSCRQTETPPRRTPPPTSQTRRKIAARQAR